MDPSSTDRILRKAEVKRLTGLSNTTLWRQERAGKFPSRVKLTGVLVGWSEQAVQEWIAERLSAGGATADAEAWRQSLPTKPQS